MGPFDTEETKEVLFYQLGDAFCYGMSNEIETLLSDSDEVGGIHLYASIAYMYLNEIISSETTISVYHALLMGRIGEEKIEKVVKQVSQDIFRELMNRYRFQNLDTLVELLNEKMITAWYFDFGLEIVSHSLRGIFLYDKYLYFIASEENTTQFAKVDSRKLFKDEQLDKQDSKRVLGVGYSQIYGFDEKLRKVYLGLENMDGFYQYYDMISNDFVICSNVLLTVRNGIPYIITKDYYFAYVLGQEIHKIKPYHDYEKYVDKKDGFFVVPKGVDSTFFYPYCVTFDGKVVSANIDDCRKYIWTYLEEVGQEVHYRYSFFGKKKEESNKIIMPEVLSIDSVLDAIRNQIPSSELCTNRKYIVFERLCELLSQYVAPSKDVTELFYTLYDLNRIVAKDCGCFPSEELYWRIREVSTSKEDSVALENAFANEDYKEVKRIIRGDIFVVNKEGKMSGLIGVFLFDENGLQTHPVQLCYGRVVGRQVLADIDLSVAHGMVSYDSGSNVFYITSNHFISKEDKMQIVKDYQLSEQQYVFVVQPREESVICEVNHTSAGDSTRSFETICNELDETGCIHISSEEWESLFASAGEFMAEMVDDGN